MTLTEISPQPDPAILEHAGDSISDSLIRTLPGNAYSSPEVFAKEQEIFNRSGKTSQSKCIIRCGRS